MLFSCNEIKRKYHKKLTIYTSMKTASISMEAALVMPLYIWVMGCMISFVIYVGIEERIQFALYNTALNISKFNYAVSYADDTIKSKIPDIDGEGRFKSFVENGLDANVIKALFVAELNDYKGEKYIDGGISGIDFMSSDIINSDGEITLTASFSLISPFNIFGLGNIDVNQKVCARAFSGNEPPVDKRYVYITANSNIYHRNKKCKTINIKVESVPKDSIGDARNKDGSKYYPCKSCGNNFNAGNYYYVTGYGSRYHTDKNCGYIHREIFKVHIDEVEGRQQCEICSWPLVDKQFD